jgi:hypothetical protein
MWFSTKFGLEVFFNDWILNIRTGYFTRPRVPHAYLSLHWPVQVNIIEIKDVPLALD